MIISIIVAVANNGVIGNAQGLPWHLPADMKFFKETTQNHTVIMGRRTAEALGRPLKNRTNLVISSTPQALPEGFILFSSLESALDSLKDSMKEEEIFVIGGGVLYTYALDHDLVDKIYLTEIDTEVEGDTYFPKLKTEHWNRIAEWKYFKDERNAFDMCFVTLERKR
jgi:dihydrofolate reductase